MSHSVLITPEHYFSKLDVIETEVAIKLAKDTFERKLAEQLNLTRVSAPLFVRPETGLNDDLNGIERPVQFDVLGIGADVAIVHSLAKWKRLALKKYGFKPSTGLYTDMNAIRRDEVLDNLHSVYVDQWDWEKTILDSDRTIAYLENTVRLIVRALAETKKALRDRFPALCLPLAEEVYFVTTQQLEDQYPDLTPKQREDAVTKQYGTVFIMQIGGKLKSGEKHDGRAPDYDDWQLNGDILIYNEVLGNALEVSSMGIRVSPQSLDAQLREAGCDDRRNMPFHKMLLNNELPLTMGGGIGQSRICMLLLEKAHIGEVQVSVWPDAMYTDCEACGIHLL